LKKRRKKHTAEEDLIDFGMTDNSKVSFEIVFQELQLEANELGRGAYGVVYKGKW
jgi:heme oxygenase